MISTKGRYALRVMIDLAEHNGEGYIPLKDIAARQEISKKYLEIIVKELVRGKMVVGQGGHGGGRDHLRQVHRGDVSCFKGTGGCFDSGAYGLLKPYGKGAFER